MLCFGAITFVIVQLLTISISATLPQLPSDILHRIGEVASTIDLKPSDIQALLLANIPELTPALQRPHVMARTHFLSSSKNKSFGIQIQPKSTTAGPLQAALDSLHNLKNAIHDAILNQSDPYDVLSFVESRPGIFLPLRYQKCTRLLKPLFKRFWNHVFDVLDELHECIDELDGLVMIVSIRDAKPVIVHQLLVMGADPAFNDYAVLKWASEKRLWWIVRACLGNVQEIRSKNVPGLADVTEHAPIDVLDLYLRKVNDLSTALYPAITTSLKANRTETLFHVLVFSGFDKDVITYTYFSAVTHGRGDLIPWLERYGLDIHAGHDHALYRAVLARHFDIATYLISRGLKLQRYDVYFMSLASHRRDLDMYLFVRRQSTRKFRPLPHRRQTTIHSNL